MPSPAGTHCASMARLPFHYAVLKAGGPVNTTSGASESAITKRVLAD